MIPLRRQETFPCLGTTLFYLLKDPVSYLEYVGRRTERIGNNHDGKLDDFGGSKVVYQRAIDSDELIPVSVVNEDNECGDGENCHPIRMVLEIGYKQRVTAIWKEKQIIYASLHYTEFSEVHSRDRYVSFLLIGLCGSTAFPFRITRILAASQELYALCGISSFRLYRPHHLLRIRAESFHWHLHFHGLHDGVRQHDSVDRRTNYDYAGESASVASLEYAAAYRSSTTFRSRPRSDTNFVSVDPHHCYDP